MRQSLRRILAKVATGEASLEDLERWIVLNITDVARERDPEVREAFTDLDVLFLQRPVGETEEADIWQAVFRWYTRLEKRGSARGQ